MRLKGKPRRNTDSPQPCLVNRSEGGGRRRGRRRRGEGWRMKMPYRASLPSATGRLKRICVRVYIWIYLCIYMHVFHVYLYSIFIFSSAESVYMRIYVRMYRRSQGQKSHLSNVFTGTYAYIHPYESVYIHMYSVHV